MEIKDFQKKFNKRTKNHKLIWNYNARFLHLIEEVGELATIEMQRKGYKQPFKNKDDLKIALADILEDILVLAKKQNISLKELMETLINE